MKWRRSKGERPKQRKRCPGTGSDIVHIMGLLKKKKKTYNGLEEDIYLEVNSSFGFYGCRPVLIN